MSDQLKQLYLKNSRIPQRYAGEISLRPTNGDAGNFQLLKKIEDNIEMFIKSHDNLLLSSNIVGNGKTSWAIKILKSFINNYACNYAWKNQTPAVFINVPEYLSLKKRSITDVSLAEEANRLEGLIYDSKLVIFDDIATKTASEYDKELLYVYINSRTNNLLTTIYTTNVTKDQLEEVLGARIADRIIGYSTVVELTGVSLRGVQFK